MCVLVVTFHCEQARPRSLHVELEIHLIIMLVKEWKLFRLHWSGSMYRYAQLGVGYDVAKRVGPGCVGNMLLM